jgi:hypothetical protein
MMMRVSAAELTAGCGRRCRRWTRRSGPPPTSSPPHPTTTAEELAQAVAYQAALISEADIEEEYNLVMAWEEADEAAYICCRNK